MNNATLFMLYEGSSPDGRGYAKLVGKTIHKAAALKHYDVVSSNPYSCGYVKIVTKDNREFCATRRDIENV